MNSFKKYLFAISLVFFSGCAKKKKVAFSDYVMEGAYLNANYGFLQSGRIGSFITPNLANEGDYQKDYQLDQFNLETGRTDQHLYFLELIPYKVKDEDDLPDGSFMKLECTITNASISEDYTVSETGTLVYPGFSPWAFQEQYPTCLNDFSYHDIDVAIPFAKMVGGFKMNLVFSVLAKSNQPIYPTVAMKLTFTADGSDPNLINIPVGTEWVWNEI
ncbi:MAG: hypothetical protein LKM30_07035 [Bacilli bacterium]|jgi:hypothetical protein|nr:hypothetical protein [Bacilli bacterium]